MNPAKMDLRSKILLLWKISTIFLFVCEVSSEEPRNLQNHRTGGVIHLQDHWIGFPKSPYATSFAVTPTPSSPPPPTSAPVASSPSKRPPRTKPPLTSKRRDDQDDYERPSYERPSNERPSYERPSNERPSYERPSNERPSYERPSNERPSYRDSSRDRYRDYVDEDFDDEYDYGDLGPVVSNPYPPSYVVRASSATPNTVYANPAVSSAGSQTIQAIYAGVPKVATYVIPNTKKYVVQRVKSEAVYVPPAVSTYPSDLYAAASSPASGRNMRRVDPLDYDDGLGGGSSNNNFLNLGPQEGFPPRPVMNKIAQPGQRQPCHGPDCHQHHKGLVRFYWRRVVYPPNARGRGRGRGRLRRPRGRRRRLRGGSGARAPSDQRDVFYTEDGDNDHEETADDADSNHPHQQEDVDEEVEDDDDEDNEEEDSRRRNVWRPGAKGYGHDLDEGSNYDDKSLKTYRDKRFVAYRRRMRRRHPPTSHTQGHE